jgi:hypothetical protein
MAKGDGKQRRPKKTPEGNTPPSIAGPLSTTPPSSSIVPQRVSNDINIPIRHQIRYGRLNKALREQLQQQQQGTSNPGGSFNPSTSSNNKKIVRTKYRRKWNDEEMQEAAQARRRKGQDPNWEVVWNQTKAAPLVIVDGYNIIYQWSRLKKHMTNGDVSSDEEPICLFSTARELGMYCSLVSLPHKIGYTNRLPVLVNCWWMIWKI